MNKNIYKTKDLIFEVYEVKENKEIKEDPKWLYEKAQNLSLSIIDFNREIKHKIQWLKEYGDIVINLINDNRNNFIDLDDEILEALNIIEEYK